MKILHTFFFLIFCANVAWASEPLRLDSRNPHYFYFRGEPLVLITSAEHYGAVINRDFDYITYLDELTRHHLNLTRIWVGPYREVPGNFEIAENTLAPRPGSFLPPWARSATPGAVDGALRFDLSRWNPLYFKRLKDFLRQAAKRGIIVEVNLFCPYYEDSMWEVSPLNARNNINSVGDVPRTEVLTLKHPKLVAVEEAMVRRIVSELNGFDNIFFEICNEPYFGGVTPDWQRHIAGLIVETEKQLSSRHLISQNIANGSEKVEDPDPAVSIFNFHYSRPPDSVALNYGLNRVIGNNETGFDGSADATYRIQGWEFLMAGGALYNNLDYSFTVKHERGDFTPNPKTPGGGSAALRRQLGILHLFFDTLPFLHMSAANHLIRNSAAAGGSICVLAEPGKVYAIYINHALIKKEGNPHCFVDGQTRKLDLAIELPGGTYEATWLDTKTGHESKRDRFTHVGSIKTLESPFYSEDVALLIRSVR
jgi:hypothetical protein